jgi:hypothetical protein
LEHYQSRAFCTAAPPRNWSATCLCAREPIRWQLGDTLAPRHIVDLRGPHAFEELERSSPVQFKKLEEIVAALREQPKRAEGQWLEVNFDARDVDLSRYLFKTSYPPKQLLQFTLENTRYILYVIRSDLVATVIATEDSKK